MRDTRTLYEIMSGPDNRVAASLSVPDPLPRNQPLRVLAVERLGQSPLDPDIARSFRAFVDGLANAGHQVNRGQLPLSVDGLAALWPDIGRAHSSPACLPTDRKSAPRPRPNMSQWRNTHACTF